MKSLIVLVGLLAVAFGSLSTENLGGPIAPVVQIPLRSGQYKVEAASADGSVAGQYGYQIDGQHFQASYTTGSQTQDANKSNNDQTYTSGTTGEVTTTTDVQAEETPKTEGTKTTTTLLTTVPIPTVDTPVPQTYGSNYPTAQQPSYYYYNVQPVPSGFYPTQQQFSYSQSSAPFTGYYIPNYINGQQYLYPRPTYTYTVGTTSNTGSSPALTGLVSPQVYTSGPAGQVSIPVAPVYQTGGIPFVTGQTGATTYTGQGGATTYTGQSGAPTYTGVTGPSGATTYTGQSGATTYTGQGGASPVFQKAVVNPATGQVYSGQRVQITPNIPSEVSGVYSSRYGYASPTFSYRSYYPVHPYRGFAQGYGYPRFHYRFNRY